MADASPDFARLTAAMVRRTPPPAEPAIPPAVEPAGEGAGWRDDLRLFLLTWAAGFVFFLVFLA